MKIQKRVPIRVGITNKSRNANAEKAKEKWQKKGWTVVNRIDGGMTKTSYLELEKEEQDTVKTTKTNKKLTLKNIGIAFAVYIILGAIYDFIWGESSDGFAIFVLLSILVGFLGVIKPSIVGLPNRKQAALGSLGGFVIFFIAFVITTNNKSDTHVTDNSKENILSIVKGGEIEKKNTAVITKKIRKEFKFTYKQFVERFNTSLRTFNPNTNLKIVNTIISNDGESVSAIVTENTSFSLWINPNTKKLQGVSFMGSMTSEAKKITDIYFGAVATVMAIENPNMTKNEIIKVTNQLGIGGKLEVDGDSIKFTRNGVHYSIFASSALGVILSADP